MTQTETPAVYKGAFTEFIKQAFGHRPIPGLKTTLLRDHPFRLDLPLREDETRPIRHVIYVGDPGYTSASVDGIIRLAAVYIAEWNRTVRYLRVISCGDSDGHGFYYEIGIDDHLYICGGCTDCSGGGSQGKRTMDGIMALLSTIYGVPIESVDFPCNGPEHQSIVRTDLESAETKELNEAPPIPVGIHTFFPGQLVRFTDEGWEHAQYRHQADSFSRSTMFQINAIETISDECSCTLGVGVTTWLHPEHCARRRRYEVMHHQVLAIKIGGAEEYHSGVNFEPA